jgi:hypothetical protein
MPEETEIVIETEQIQYPLSSGLTQFLLIKSGLILDNNKVNTGYSYLTDKLRTKGYGDKKSHKENSFDDKLRNKYQLDKYDLINVTIFMNYPHLFFRLKPEYRSKEQSTIQEETPSGDSPTYGGSRNNKSRKSLKRKSKTSKRKSKASKRKGRRSTRRKSNRKNSKVLKGGKSFCSPVDNMVYEKGFNFGNLKLNDTFIPVSQNSVLQSDDALHHPS